LVIAKCHYLIKGFNGPRHDGPLQYSFFAIGPIAFPLPAPSLPTNSITSPDRTRAWFDELLDPASHSLYRRSGVQFRQNGTGKIAQYQFATPCPIRCSPKISGTASWRE